MKLRKRTLLGLLGCLLTSAIRSSWGQTASNSAGLPTTTIVFPLEEVRPGLHGVAYTVFSGVTPETMAVEILGRLTNALGPKRDLILARLHGTKPEYTGVVAGMSGSPVYIDGRLVGALSYRIGQFSKEPIAGITPIEQMLEVSGLSGGMPAPVNSSGVGGEMQPMEAPLVFNGFSPETLARFGNGFRALGMSPISGLGGADASKRQPAPLQPGSAVSAILVQGDLSVTGTCTVSFVDATRLLACGHPLTQAGEIDLPMAKAEVVATLASPLNSFKIVNATEVVGAFTQDRSSAIYGRLGAHARMIPVTIHLSAEETKREAKTMRFEVATHRELTPQLMMAAVYQSLQQVLSGSADSSYKLEGEIRLARRPHGSEPGVTLPPVKLEGWQSQSGFNPGAVNAALAIGERFLQLFANPDEQPEMTGVDLQVVTSARRRAASIQRAETDETEVRPGETIEVEAVVQPYQQATERLRTRLALPNTLEAGTVRLLISDGATLDRLLDPTTAHALNLSDTVKRLNATHANDRVYVTLLTHSAQAVLDADALSEVPLSMANVFEPLRATQTARLNGESMVELGSMTANDAVSGSQVLTLTVR